MIKLINKYLNTKILKFLLFFFCLILSFYQLFYGDFSFTILTQNTSLNLKNNINQKINFKSKNNNLALIGIKINNSLNITNETITFELYENQKLLQNLKVRSTFASEDYFYFGLNPITNSKNKEYTLLISSNNKNSKITISKNSPQLILKYKFNKNELLKNPNTLFNFIYQKTAYNLQNSENSYPLKFIWGIFILSILNFYPGIILLIIMDIIFINKSYDIVYLISLISLYVSKNQKNNSIFKTALLGFIIAAILSILNLDKFIEKEIAYTYLILIVGVVSLKN